MELRGHAIDFHLQAAPICFEEVLQLSAAVLIRVLLLSLFSNCRIPISCGLTSSLAREEQDAFRLTGVDPLLHRQIKFLSLLPGE